MKQTVFARRSQMPVTADELFAWHARPGAFERLTPPWQPVRLARFDGIRDGDLAVLKLPAGPFELTWVAEHREYVEGRQFMDVQRSGPFAHWAHTHRMIPTENGTSELEDHIVYALPLSALSTPLAGRFAERQLEEMFAYRHRITRNDLEIHRRYATESLTVAITGASGLIGRALTSFLTTGGHRVLRLVRSHDACGEDTIYWNPATGEIETDRLEGVDAVVHLAGEPVFGRRYTEDKKRRILHSRVAGTDLLSRTLAGLEQPPRVLVSASAVGYYGDGFLAEVARAWEAATEPAEAAGLRVVHARIGIVLSPLGGALQVMLPPFRLGLGGWIGDPGPMLSWITIDDTVQALYHLIWTETLSGAVNVVGPEPASMRAFAQTLGAVLHRPVVLRAPERLIRTLGGEAVEETILQSLRAHPERLTATDFTFLHDDLDAGLRHLLGKTASD